MRVLTWNLFHGRARPAAGRPLAAEFARTIAGWEWDVALLQEVPPWWPPALARAAGAEHDTVRTSRNALLPLRRAIAARNPDLVKAGGGGANAILVRGRIRARRAVRLTAWPERRYAHGVRTDHGWVVNLHASLAPGWRTHADLARAVAAWPEHPLVLGGDLNLREPPDLALDHAGGHFVDHVLVRGHVAAESERLDAGSLSDHDPVLVALE